MDEILLRLEKIRRYAKGLPISEENQDEFLSFCALGFLEGRDVRTRSYYLYVDFVRKWCGRDAKYRSKREILVTPEVLEEQAAPCKELLKLEKLHAKKTVERIMKALSLSDQLIIRMIYLENLDGQDVAKILGISDGRVSQKKSQILRRMKSIALLDFRM